MSALPFFTLAPQIAGSRQELVGAFERVLDRGITILGPEVEAFEREFAGYCGVQHGVGAGNGLDALALALRSLGVGAGDEVIVPSHTFIATWLAVSSIGAVPVPVDVDGDTYTIDPGLVADALTPRTRALIAVHLYGHPADMAALARAVAGRGIAIVEDAAQAHGARHRGSRAGSLGDVAAFSFYPTKNLGALGDGGMVVTRDEAVARRTRLIGNYGSARKYVHDEKGINSRLDEVQAAILRVILPGLDARNAKRRRIAQRYAEGLAGLPIVLPTTRHWAEHVWHLFVVQVPQRDRLVRFLADRGIATIVHYPTPPYRTGAYAELAGRAREWPVAERLAGTVLSLPLWPDMDEAEIARVIDSVRAFHGG
jgi:dTDP-4-amino-4,6-dideoxygalactose transaminase